MIRPRLAGFEVIGDNLEIDYVNRDGSTNVQSVTEQVGISSRLPVGNTQVLLAVPGEAVRFIVKRARGTLHGYSDFHAFGLSLFGRPDERWTYVLPDIVSLRREP